MNAVGLRAPRDYPKYMVWTVVELDTETFFYFFLTWKSIKEMKLYFFPLSNPSLWFTFGQGIISTANNTGS